MTTCMLSNGLFQNHAISQNHLYLSACDVCVSLPCRISFLEMALYGLFIVVSLVSVERYFQIMKTIELSNHIHEDEKKPVPCFGSERRKKMMGNTTMREEGSTVFIVIGIEFIQHLWLQLSILEHSWFGHGSARCLRSGLRSRTIDRFRCHAIQYLFNAIASDIFYLQNRLNGCLCVSVRVHSIKK